jgi:hypothetical protein
MGMLNNVTSMMGNMGSGGSPPDMSGMMQMMTTMMSGMKMPGPQVEDVSEKVIENEKK